MEREFPLVAGDRDVEVGGTGGIGDVGAEWVRAECEARVELQDPSHLHGGPADGLGGIPASRVVGRVTGAIDGGHRADGSGSIDADVRQREDRHEAHWLAGRICSPNRERIGAG